MSLEKRIKRHLIGRRQALFAIVPPGLEAVCREELTALSDSIQVADAIRGGLPFSGRMIDIYRANLHLRTAGRILLRLARFKATNFRQLEKKAVALAWEFYLPQGAVPQCRVACRRSRLYHSRAVDQVLRKGIARYWQGLDANAWTDPDQTLYVRLEDDWLNLSLDTSGDPLFQRGLKTHSSQAPLRETLAAGILKLAGYRPDRPLLDPMCGSGTFALEAALWSKQIPPGYSRDFAFVHWPAFRRRQWRHLIQEAEEGIRSYKRPLILASDIDTTACKRLSDCVATHRLNDAAIVQQQDFFDLKGSSEQTPPGLIVLNPPYGRRLSPDEEVRSFYKRIAGHLKENFKGWRIALILPKRSLIDALALPLAATPLVHGGLHLTLLTGKIP